MRTRGLKSHRPLNRTDLGVLGIFLTLCPRLLRFCYMFDQARNTNNTPSSISVDCKYRS